MLRFPSIVIRTAVGLLLASPALAQWVPSVGPFGGHVQSLSVHDGVLFAGTHGDQAYRSVDDGATWQPASRGLHRTVRPRGLPGRRVVPLI
jgi:hypothetical protein